MLLTNTRFELVRESEGETTHEERKALRHRCPPGLHRRPPALHARLAACLGLLPRFLSLTPTWIRDERGRGTERSRGLAASGRPPGRRSSHRPKSHSPRLPSPLRGGAPCPSNPVPKVVPEHALSPGPNSR